MIAHDNDGTLVLNYWRRLIEGRKVALDAVVKNTTLENGALITDFLRIRVKSSLRIYHIRILVLEVNERGDFHDFLYSFFL